MIPLLERPRSKRLPDSLPTQTINTDIKKGQENKNKEGLSAKDAQRLSVIGGHINSAMQLFLNHDRVNPLPPEEPHPSGHYSNTIRGEYASIRQGEITVTFSGTDGTRWEIDRKEMGADKAYAIQVRRSYPKEEAWTTMDLMVPYDENHPSPNVRPYVTVEKPRVWVAPQDSDGEKNTTEVQPTLLERNSERAITEAERLVSEMLNTRPRRKRTKGVSRIFFGSGETVVTKQSEPTPQVEHFLDAWAQDGSVKPQVLVYRSPKAA